MSKTKLLLGAAGLLLFLVGLKRSHRVEETGLELDETGSAPGSQESDALHAGDSDGGALDQRSQVT